VITSSKWTAKHGYVPGTATGHIYEGSDKEYVFALILGQDLLSNAKGLGHHTADVHKYDQIFGLQCLLMAIDDSEQGSIYINVDQKASPFLYKKTVETLARWFTGAAKKGDEITVKKHVCGSKWFSLDHQADIKAAIENLGKKDAEEPADDALEHEEPAGKRPRVEHVDIYNDPRFQRQYFVGLMGPLFNTVDESLPHIEIYNIYNTNDPQGPDPAGPEGPPGGDDAVFDGEDVINGDQMSALQKMASVTGNRVFPKVRYMLSPVTDKNNADIVIGYLIRIIPVDPTWNPGKTIQKMMDERRKRLVHMHDKWYKDPYVKYYLFRDSMFPVFHVAQDQWIQLCNNVCGSEGSTFENIGMQLGTERVSVYSSMLHPIHIFTLDRALARLIQYGADPMIYTKENFTVGTGPSGAVRWPPGPAGAHYTYLPEQVFWYDPHELGLFEMAFPNLNMSNEALFEMNQFDQDDEEINMQSGASALDKLSETRPVLRRSDVLKTIPMTGALPTRNIILLTAIDADQTEKRIEKHRPHHYDDTMRKAIGGELLPENPLVQECVRYSRMMEVSHAHYMKQFENIFNLDCDVTYISIPDTLKVLVRWMQDNFKNNSISRYMCKFDVNMSLFANAISQHSLRLERLMKLAQPLIAIKAEGLFSVYARRKGQLLFHYCNYGGKDKGKSYTVINGGKAQMIPGSYTDEQIATDAAYLTDTDYEHVILFRDEIEEFIVNPKLANGKDAKKANVKKATMTSGETHLRVFEKMEVPGTGRTIRTSRQVGCRTNIAECATTNFSVEPGVSSSALVSRYFVESMKSCTAAIDQYNWKCSPKEKKEAENFFCINQAMSAIIEQAMTMNAIVRSPSMTMWEDIRGRITDGLRNRGILGREDGVRGLAKWDVFMRQLIVKMAIHYAYDVPGAPFYGKSFEPSQLTEVQRYLYFQSDYALYMVPLLISEFINEDCGNVLRAMCTLCQLSFGPNSTMYEQYTTDPNARACIGRKYNTKFNKMDPSQGPQEWVELNYFQIDGDMKQIAQKIAEKTHPRMDVNNVVGVLKMLEKRLYTPERYFPPVDPITLNNHNVITKKKTMLAHDGIDRIINEMTRECGMDSTQLHQLEKEYEGKTLEECFDANTVANIIASITGTRGVLTNPGGPAGPFEQAAILKLRPFQVDMIQRMFQRKCVWENGTVDTYVIQSFVGQKPTVDALTGASGPPSSAGGRQSIPVVKYDDTYKGHKKLMFSPEAILLFTPEVIIQILEDALLCGTTAPGKKLIGFTHKDDMTKFHTINWSREFIGAYIKHHDQYESPHMPSRNEGLVFNRRGFQSAAMMSMLSRDDTFISESDANPIVLVRDIDYESALEHHLKCPDPLKEPVRSLAYIEEAYIKAIRQNPRAWPAHASQQYPETLIAEKQRASATYWDRDQKPTIPRDVRMQLEELKLKRI
jgi:hypothetical protein